jgi:DNA-directed RNA polymerase specialized sigma24 family protein
MIVARSSEKKNLRRWGTSVFEALVHEIVAEAMGSDLAGLRRIAYFDNLGAGYHGRLMTTFRRRIIDQHRRWEAKEGRHLSMDADDGGRKLVPEAVDFQGDPASAAVSAEFYALMERLMHEVLTPVERGLLVGEMTGQSSRGERATRLGIKEGALAVKLFRIREKLKSALGEACQHSDYFR